MSELQRDKKKAFNEEINNVFSKLEQMDKKEQDCNINVDSVNKIIENYYA